MINKNELVIRWLEEPVDATCGLCKSGKKMNFKKGPVVSLISGELVCLKCAAMHNKNLWDVCSSYAEFLRERNWITPIDDMQTYDPNLNDHVGLEKYDRGILKRDEYDDHLVSKYDEPSINEADRCRRCAHEFQQKK
jgi:hypothetical protein